MNLSVVYVLIFVIATLLVGCSSSNDLDGGGADLPLSDSVDSDIDISGSLGDNDAEATPDPLITFDSQETLLEEVFGIYAGEVWDRTPLSLSEFGPLFEFREVIPGTEGPEFPASVGPALCSSGDGELSVEVPSGRGNHSWQARLNACVPQDPATTGLLLVSGIVSGDWNWHTSSRSDDLTWIRTSGESVTFSGEMRWIPDESNTDTVQSFVTADAHQHVLSDGVEAPILSIEQATSTLRGGMINGVVDVASMSGGFTYRSALTGDQTVTVRTPLQFAYRWDVRAPAPDGIAPETLGELPLGNVLAGESRDEEQDAAVNRVRQRWAFVTGMLELEAEDGSRVTLDADTGNLDTVRITLDDGRGDGADERVIEWPSRWFQVIAPGTLLSARME